MNFPPVPPGTDDAGALALRGPDPDVSVASADTFITTLGHALNARPGPVANTQLTKWSAVMGALVGGMFTSDAAVLDQVASLGVIALAKGRAHWLQLIADGLRDDTAMTLEEFRAARDEIVDQLDRTTLAGGYMVTAADLMLTQPVAGAAAVIGGNASAWVRTLQVRMFAVHVGDGIYRLTHLAELYAQAPGIFITAHRDQLGRPFRIIMEQCRQAAESARVGYADEGCGYPLGTAQVAATYFCRTFNMPEWRVPLRRSDPLDLGCQLMVARERLALCATGAEDDGGQNFRFTFCTHFYSFITAIPSLVEVMSPGLAPLEIETLLARLCSDGFSPARPALASADQVRSLENTIRGSMPPLRSENLTTAEAKVDWLITHLPHGLLGLERRDGTATSEPGSYDKDLKKAMATPEVQAHLDGVTAQAAFHARDLQRHPLGRRKARRP